MAPHAFSLGPEPPAVTSPRHRGVGHPSAAKPQARPEIPAKRPLSPPKQSKREAAGVPTQARNRGAGSDRGRLTDLGRSGGWGARAAPSPARAISTAGAAAGGAAPATRGPWGGDGEGARFWGLRICVCFLSVPLLTSTFRRGGRAAAAAAAAVVFAFCACVHSPLALPRLCFFSLRDFSFFPVCSSVRSKAD
jgi:hypothetical protein